MIANELGVSKLELGLNYEYMGEFSGCRVYEDNI